MTNATGTTAASTAGMILKAGTDDERLVFGWASVIEEGGAAVVDSQGDVIEVADLQDAAIGFMVDARKGGFMHVKVDGAAVKIGEVVESLVMTKAKQAALGIDLGKVGWLITMKVNDDDVWAAVKDGTLKAFSIGGRGVRTPLEPSA